ncbi:hypothetical protein [Microbulbifer discodermiae]|uniref:hypothetical protein n=1 Tax=Microbulbifer sp. 2201CG32-9 TaxID=3232309 RepID=UPI00345B6516
MKAVSLYKRVGALIRLWQLSIRWQLGIPVGWLLAILLLWPGMHFLAASLWMENGYDLRQVQNQLIGFPAYLIAVLLGARLIAREVDKRTLEVAYTLPRGIGFVWWQKMWAASLLLCICTLCLALAAALLRPYPGWILLQALAGTIFYFILACVLGTWLRSEFSAQLLAFVALGFNLLASQNHWLPLFNPLRLEDVDSHQQWTMMWQNFTLVTAVVLICGSLAWLRIQSSENTLR